MPANDNLLNRLKKYLPQDLYLETVQRFTQHEEKIKRTKSMINSLKKHLQQIQGYTEQLNESTQRIKDTAQDSNLQLSNFDFYLEEKS